MAEAERFEAFVRKYQDLVYGTALRLLGSPTEAEDAAQTVFLRAFERFSSLETAPAAPGWLRTVTTNLCLNHLSRYRARWRLFSELGRGPATPDGLEARLTTPAKAFEDDPEVRSRRLSQALQALPDHQRVPIVLFHYEGRSYQQIAATLGISLGKVKTDIHRGREALKRQLTTP